MKELSKNSILTLCLMLFSIVAFSQEQPDSTVVAIADSTSVAAKKDTSEVKKKPTVAEKTKSCKKIDGLFPIYQDTAKGNIFMAVMKNQLDKEFIHFFHAENGGLNYGWVKGTFGWEKVFKIRKYFDRIEFVEQNTNYYFDEENALAKASKANINEPIFSSQKIEVESGDTLLIAADGFFKSQNLAQLQFASPPGRGPKILLN